MRDDRGVQRDDKPGPGGPGGVRAPAPGESSSSNMPGLDAPTVANVPASDILSGATSPGYLPFQSGQNSAYGSMYGQAQLEPGTVLGNRYEILHLLGMGGMGAVYKARDLEIGRLVAIKVIRPDLARDPAIVDRFRQELLLATRVTHKNVIRIYDLAEADGMKLISMEYVDGKDLCGVLKEKKKFQPADAIALIRQVCRALQAAHSVGVVHRDLKPQNILCESGGRVLVMDFGLARTFEDNGMTQSGSLVGTIDYMSPEQALCKTVDQRSDIFALGIIFYELLSGHTPFRAQSAVASLILRTQEPAVPLAQVEPTAPKILSDIVGKCLERDVALRYQDVAEILVDLDSFEGKGPATQIHSIALPVSRPFIRRKLPRKIVSISAVFLLLLLGVFFRSSIVARFSGEASAKAGPIVSLAVFPLRNASGDASLDWMSTSLADMLSTAVGQSAHLRTVSPERLRQIYSDLRLSPESTIDAPMLKRIADFTTADRIVSGQYVRLGDQVHIDVVIQDLTSSESTSFKAQSGEKELPVAIGSLADSIRKSLSLSTAEIKAAQAQSFQAVSASVDALRDYNQGHVMARAGKNLLAEKQLSAAVQEDPQFALAYSLLGQVQAELGFQTEAGQSSRRAIELAESQDLPHVVLDLIKANHARVTQSNKKAIDAYEALSRNLPGDTDVQSALAGLYIETSAYDKARTLITNMLKDDPKDVRALWQMGVIEITSNNPEAALDPLNQALSLTIQTNNLEMKALAELAIGISYRLLNKPEDALRNYEDSIAINERLGQKRGVAAALAEKAQVQSTSGNSDGALASYQKALKLLREIGMNKEVGDTLMDMGVLLSQRGQSDQALQAYQEALKTQRESGNENFESLCLNNIASVYVSRGDTGSALTYFQQALQLREKLGVQSFIAETLAGMGEAYTRDGQYDEAIKLLVRALDLSRKADDQRSAALISHQIGMVFAHQGRFGAAVTSMQDALKQLHALGDKTKDLVEVQNDLSATLAASGKESEATAALEGAEAAARELKSDPLMAEILNTRGDIEFYRGNLQAAAQQYQKALQLVGRSKDVGVVVLTRLNLARIALAKGRAQETIAALSPLIEKRATFDKLLDVRISTTLSEALIQTRALPRARQALLSDLGEAEKAGMKPEIGRIYYLLSMIAIDAKNTGDALSYGQQAVKAFDSIRFERGGESFLLRTDAKDAYLACTQTVAAGKTSH